jgi:UDP-glucose 4-epimerase
MARVFVTGGAGYIGSHVAAALGEAGHHVLVYDDLSTGNRRVVLHGTLVEGSLHDAALLRETIAAFRPDVAMHFAGSILVEESMREPLRYYRNNTLGTLALMGALMALRAPVRIVFSSTATLYGNVAVEDAPIPETAPLVPINPYGYSKLVSERALEALGAIRPDFRYLALRYFNVAGADGRGRIGQAYPEATHLITLGLRAALGLRDGLDLFGTDYPTPDGTCVRDYIHVDDLASAHLAAMAHLMDGGQSIALNCGYGHGHSVREVIGAIREVTGVDFPVREVGRRPGDPPVLVACTSEIRRVLGWAPRYDDLDYIIKTAWDWERRLAAS